MCDYIGKDFGADYPDSICINGYLWDMDSGHSDPSGEFDWLYTNGGEMPCPECNPSNLIQGMYEENQNIIDSDYMECPICGGVLRDDYGWADQICEYCGKNIWE